MAAYNKFFSFTEAVMEKVHNMGADTLTVALSNVAPATGNTVLANITQISYANISSRVLTVTSSAQAGGTYTLVIADLVLTATGTVGPFRYVVFYNDTATNDELICWFDHGTSITMENTDTYTLDFGANLFTFA